LNALNFWGDNPSANLIEKHDPKKKHHNGARVCLATYPKMLGLIDEMQNGQREYGPWHFDLIVIDEAHRSIFDYFDSMLVALNAADQTQLRGCVSSKNSTVWSVRTFGPHTALLQSHPFRSPA